MWKFASADIDVTARLSMVWLIPQHMHTRTCFWGWVLVWKGWISTAIGNSKLPQRDGVSMTPTQTEKAKQVTETCARIPDKKIILYQFHLGMSFKPCRKLNCFTEGQSSPSVSLALSASFQKKKWYFRERKTLVGGLLITKMMHNGRKSVKSSYMITLKVLRVFLYRNYARRIENIKVWLASRSLNLPLDRCVDFLQLFLLVLFKIVFSCI